MSLSDKLNRARTERMIAAGLLPSEAALKPDTVEDAPFARPEPIDPIQIDVRPTALFSVTDQPAARSGAKPTDDHPCPNCQAIGKVDLVDLVGKRVHVSCPRCGSMWQVRTDLAADQPR